jgi:hypothetical protein
MKKIYFYINIIFLSFYTLSQAQITANGRGLFHIRNQFPINLQFLSIFAEDPEVVQEGVLNFSIQYTHSNTFAMSDEKSGDLIDAGVRYRYIPNTQNETDGNEYYFDTASGIFNFNMRYGFSDRVELGIDIPLITFLHGFLDSPIEFFHNTFGYANYKRALILKNQSDLYIKNNKYNYYRNKGFGIGDISLNIKTKLFKAKHNLMNISLLSSLKLPTGNYEQLNGSGSFDYGFNLLINDQWKNHFITNNLSIILPGEWSLFKSINPGNIYSWVIGYEYFCSQYWSFLLQHRIQNSPLNSNDYPLAAKLSFEITSGVKVDIFKKTVLSFAITQNYINHENVPDFGFLVGIAAHL